MAGCCEHGSYVGRRNFIKLSALAGAAAAASAPMPAAAQTRAASGISKVAFKASPPGNKRNLLFLFSGQRQRYEPLLEKIRAIKEYEINVSPTQVNVQTEGKNVNPAQLKETDMVVIVPSMGTTGRAADTMPAPSSPVIIYSGAPELIMVDADIAGQFRSTGVNAQLAESEDHLFELIKIAAAPRILEGKKALIFGRPMDSTSVPSGGVSEDYIYQHTGLRLQYRPIEELKESLTSISDASARVEMERWKKEATSIVETTDRAILDSSRLYHLLRSIAEKEQLDGISIDCLSFSFDNEPILPYPCLPFTRLRDDGYAVPCEADVCGMLSSMVLQMISKRSSYLYNVSEVKTSTSTIVLRHCVSPLKMMGWDAPSMPYRMRDYHGTGRGATAEIQFPMDMDVTMGGFSKDLREFVLWPGRTVRRELDTNTLSFPGSNNPMRKFCTNHLEVKIKDMDSFIQNIVNSHHVMVTGSYRKPLHDAMTRMNIRVIGPSDFSPPV